MNPSEYQKLASRTDPDRTEQVTGKLAESTPIGSRLLHSVVGLMGDAGELASAVEKWLYYNQRLDITNVKEEIGDCLWYLAQACNAIGVDMGEIMELNIAKLQKRFPEKYSDELAAEKNRDRAAEREILEQTPTDNELTNSKFTAECMSCGKVVKVRRAGDIPNGWTYFNGGKGQTVCSLPCYAKASDKNSGFRETSTERTQTGQGWAEPPLAENAAYGKDLPSNVD